jgi:pyruvate, orthophosphate dikinase
MAELKVMANADTPESVSKARKYGAVGIGLCRTERMFNQPERLPIVQEMILAESGEEREKSLKRLLPFQREDFKEIFRIMDGLPTTIRLLDPPIHEFLPADAELVAEINNLKELVRTVELMGALPDTLKLLDPQLHNKYAANLETITHGLEELRNKHLAENLIQPRRTCCKRSAPWRKPTPCSGIGGAPGHHLSRDLRHADSSHHGSGGGVREGEHPGLPEIMVPQVCTLQELVFVHKHVVQIHKEVEKKFGVKVPYKFGTMIEVVRACMRAGRLAELAEFMSFGTNDLTQATFSFSQGKMRKTSSCPCTTNGAFCSTIPLKSWISKAWAGS